MRLARVVVVVSALAFGPSACGSSSTARDPSTSDTAPSATKDQQRPTSTSVNKPVDSSVPDRVDLSKLGGAAIDSGGVTCRLPSYTAGGDYLNAVCDQGRQVIAVLTSESAQAASPLTCDPRSDGGARWQCTAGSAHTSITAGGPTEAETRKLLSALAERVRAAAA